MSTAINRTVTVRFDRSSNVLAMMNWFARQGLPVFPIHSVTDGQCSCGKNKCENAGKHPIGSLAPKGANSASTDVRTIRKWHRAVPEMNYGVATEGLAVIDCDSRDAVADFRRTYGPPPTFTVKTARSFHFYFRGEVRTRIGARAKLDVKSGPGSYVVGPGSVHASGAMYAQWEDVPIAELPDAIREISARSDHNNAPLDDGGIPKGLRNNTLTKFAGYLRSVGAGEIAMLEALKALNRTMTDDPLPDREVRQIARSIAQKPTKTWPKLEPFSDIVEETLEWLWYPYICRGTLGLLDGDPGDGKSQFCAWLCARISRGDTLPGGDTIKPANVFLFNFEDLKGSVIKPRLAANGADLSRVFIQSRPFQLTEELVEWLDGEIAEKRPALVFLDPIQAFMSGVDGNSNIDVREFMSRLGEIAAKYLCAIICVRHFGKSEQDKAMKKGLGSTDFVGISRNQWGQARRTDEVPGFILLHMKTNFERGKSMLFKMSQADGRKGEQPKIAFDRFEDVDADSFFARQSPKRGPTPDDCDFAEEYLRERLADGPVQVSTIKRDCEARGISHSTRNRAADNLKVLKVRQDDGRWTWSLPMNE